MKLDELLTEDVLPGLVFTSWLDEQGFVNSGIETIDAFDEDTHKKISSGEEVTPKTGIARINEFIDSVDGTNSNRDKQIAASKFRDFMEMLKGYHGRFYYSELHPQGFPTATIYFNKQTKVIQFPGN